MALTGATQQLVDESNGLISKYDSEGNDLVISLIFLTNEVNDKSIDVFKKYCDQFNGSNDNMFGNKVHYQWKNKDEIISVYNMLLSVLNLDNVGEIDPIHEYTRYTIKSFLNFINNDFSSYLVEVQSNREKKSYGKPVSEYVLDLFKKIGDDEVSYQDAIKTIEEMIVVAGYDIPRNASTITAPLASAIVNNPSRVHHYVKEPLPEGKSLFYFIDPEEKTSKKISKFSVDSGDLDNINIYWRDANKEDHCCKYGDLDSSYLNEKKLKDI